MKSYRIYIWVVAYIILSNACFYHAVYMWVFNLQPEQPSLVNDFFGACEKQLGWSVVIFQFPSLILGRLIANLFNLSLLGWTITNSIISILIYSPLIHLTRHWSLSGKLHSIRQRASDFSASLAPRNSGR